MKIRVQSTRIGIILALVGPGCAPGDGGPPESGSGDSVTVMSRVVAGVESPAAPADGDTISLITTDSTVQEVDRTHRSLVGTGHRTGRVEPERPPRL